MKLADVKPMLLPTSIRRVNDKLYRGNAIFSPIKALRLKKIGITQVIDLRHEDGIFVNLFKSLEKFYCKMLNIKYYHTNFYNKNDYSIPNNDFFEGINKIIDDNKKSYVHCHYGKHRTGFTVAMYEKSIGIPRNKIITELLKYGWKRNKKPELQASLEAFLQKFFKPNN